MQGKERVGREKIYNTIKSSLNLFYLKVFMYIKYTLGFVQFGLSSTLACNILAAVKWAGQVPLVVTLAL